jgi:hypothetical protein
MDIADLAASMKDHHIDKRGKLSDVAAGHPVVRPEETGSAIAEMPRGRHVRTMAWTSGSCERGSVTPGAVWVGALKLNPSGTQG